MATPTVSTTRLSRPVVPRTGPASSNGNRWFSFSRNANLPLALRIIHNTQRLLNLPAYGLNLILILGMMISPSAVWLLGLPYLLSAIGLTIINFVERNAADGSGNSSDVFRERNGLTERKYLRLQAAKVGVTVLCYAPAFAAWMFSEKVALVMTFVRLHNGWFWKTLIAFNVVHWVSVFTSLFYGVCFYRPADEGTIRLDDGINAPRSSALNQQTASDEEYARSLQAQEPGWEQP